MSTETEVAFKLAMRRLAATVTLITLTDKDASKGMAATAVCSLSLEPPSLIACVNKSASLHTPLMTATHFCVNVLHEEQVDIARLFSSDSSRAVRFESSHWRRHETGPPILEGAQVSIICERMELFAFGTHTIVVGQAIDVINREDIDPLLFFNGTFHRSRVK